MCKFKQARKQYRYIKQHNKRDFTINILASTNPKVRNYANDLNFIGCKKLIKFVLGLLKTTSFLCWIMFIQI